MIEREGVLPSSIDQRLVLPPTFDVPGPTDKKPIILYGPNNRTVILEVKRLEDEVKRPPTLLVDRKLRTVVFEHQQRAVEFRGDLMWAAFMEFARRPNETITTQQLKKILTEGESNNPNHPGRIVYGIRWLLEDDPKNPQLLISSGRGTDARFTLKADVRFSDQEEEVVQEVVGIPEMLVDISKRTIHVSGKTLKFWRGQPKPWTMVLFFANNPNVDIQGDKVREVAEEVGYGSEFAGKDAVNLLRRKFRRAGINERLIITVDPSIYSLYRLEANVKFIGEEPARSKLEFLEDESKIRIDQRTIPLTQREVALLRVLARNIGKRIKSGKIAQEAFDSPDAKAARVQEAAADLKKKLNELEGSQYIFSSGRRGIYSWVMLRGVSVIQPEGVE